MRNSLPCKFFRQINLEVGSLVKSYFHGIFEIKRWQWNSVISTLRVAHCWKSVNSLSRNFGKNFVKLAVTQWITKKLIWRKFCKNRGGKNLQITTPQCGNVGTLPPLQISTLCTLCSLSLTQFWQKFRESRGFTKWITK